MGRYTEIIAVCRRYRVIIFLSIYRTVFYSITIIAVVYSLLYRPICCTITVELPHTLYAVVTATNYC